MIFWTTFNIVTAVGAALVLVFMLFAYEQRFTFLERLVIVGMASSMVLRIGPILGTNLLKVDSPFDYWSVSLLQLSFLIGALCVTARLEGVNVSHLAGKLLNRLRRH